ncbi:uncharacterized protein DSM5745_03661 [Aspergillus mulundensis]|uniref:Uncharacterized protein n=1 Tax=Aspergillus mulundensis TaxID=1810919 RepID=A0A3D8SL12_9EURO|nr:hypothetical protein DSM5745_03661 [Aspergillus mulundensis]RDW87019.1 hypothetical protein DSM5745_03661 [Aspergillus mulundensis]
MLISRIYPCLALGLGLLPSALAQGTNLPSLEEAYIEIASDYCINAFADLGQPYDDRSNCVTVGIVERSYIEDRDNQGNPARYLDVDTGNNNRLIFNPGPIFPTLWWFHNGTSSGDGRYGALFLGRASNDPVYGPDWQVSPDGTVFAANSDTQNPVQLVLVDRSAAAAA